MAPSVDSWFINASNFWNKDSDKNVLLKVANQSTLITHGTPVSQNIHLVICIATLCRTVVEIWSSEDYNGQWINTMRPRQNGHHFTNDIFKCIFLNESVWISIKISLMFVPKVRINKIPAKKKIPALVQIMAWCQPGDKPLSEPMMIRLPMHMHHSASMS